MRQSIKEQTDLQTFPWATFRINFLSKPNKVFTIIKMKTYSKAPFTIRQLKRIEECWNRSTTVQEVAGVVNFTEEVFLQKIMTLTGLTQEQISSIFLQSNRRICLKDVSEAYGVELKSLQQIFPDWAQKVEKIKSTIFKRKKLSKIARLFDLTLSELVELVFNQGNSLEEQMNACIAKKRLKIEEATQNLAEHNTNPEKNHPEVSILPASNCVFNLSGGGLKWTHLPSKIIGHCKISKVIYSDNFVELPDWSLLSVGYKGETWKILFKKEYSVLKIPNTKIRQCYKCVVYFRGFVYAMIGDDNFSERYNLYNQVWEQLPKFPFHLNSCTAVAMELTHALYLMGGITSLSPNHYVFVLSLTDLRWSYISLIDSYMNNLACFTLANCSKSIYYMNGNKLYKLDILSESEEFVKDFPVMAHYSPPRLCYYFNKNLYYQCNFEFRPELYVGELI